MFLFWSESNAWHLTYVLTLH